MDYQKGKIYKIESHAGPKIYVGSTTKDKLSQRMASHRSDYRKWKSDKIKYCKVMSFDMFDEYGIENCQIVLLELYPCNTKDELTSKESFYIRTLDCVNRYIPDRTYKEYNKQYYEKNKEKLCEKNKTYRKDNKDKIKESKTKPFSCECGSKIQHTEKARHQRCKKHLNYLASKPE